MTGHKRSIVQIIGLLCIDTVMTLQIIGLFKHCPGVDDNFQINQRRFV